MHLIFCLSLCNKIKFTAILKVYVNYNSFCWEGLYFSMDLIIKYG